MERAEIGPSVTGHEVKPAVQVYGVNRIPTQQMIWALALAAKDAD